MSKLSSYRKSIAVAVTALAGLIVSWLTGEGVSEDEWRGFAALVVAAVLAYAFRNEPYPDPQNPDGVV